MYNQGYPPTTGNYPPPGQGGYQSNQGAYPPPSQGAYPPPSQGAYPPPQGGYPPSQGAYPPPSQGAYPPPQGGYPPASGAPYGPEPLYKQITVGRGIDMNEYNSIVGVIKQIYMSKVQPMASACADGIRRTIGGDWFVFISDVGIEDFDFSLTRVKGGDFIAFSLDSKKFQVCRIR